MAEQMRLVHRYPKNTRAADEEQPFRDLDVRAHRDLSDQARRRYECLSDCRMYCLGIIVCVNIFLMTLAFITPVKNSKRSIVKTFEGCDVIEGGYQCQRQISRYWGQYSPYFHVPSEIPSGIPATCQITFAQVLSRHGGRDPTAGKSILYAETIDKIKGNSQRFDGNYAFLANYTYNLGSDQLTAFGEQQMINSGIDFFTRYSSLTTAITPFMRASGQERVIDSAQKFGQGFHEARVATSKSNDAQYPYDVVVISEAPGSNNTLDHGLCTAFEASNTSWIARNEFASTFIPAISARLNAGLPGANLTDLETIFLMDLCPFGTVASPLGSPSQFCTLFTQEEWKQYDYYQTLGKYYGFGPGNTLGPTQGVGYVNELIARLTGKPVVDRTTSNSTLDNDPATFPFGRILYADFGHDNDMTAVFAALGLYNSTPPLSTTELMTIETMKGYSAAWTVPFAGRALFEKMMCKGMKEEMVRVLVNGRVLPLQMCGGDTFGRCSLSDFVKSLSFARNDGHWDQCFSSSEGAVFDGLKPTGYDNAVQTS